MAASEVVREVSLEEAVQRGRATYAEWGARLTLDQFLDRERCLRSGEWSKRSVSTWFLEAGGECLSSCELFRVASSFRGKAGTALGFASVYTEPALRGKGYAKRLLEGVQARLQPSIPELQAFYLFSDIEPAYYEALGYRARPAWDRVLPPEPGDPFESASPIPYLPSTLVFPASPFALNPPPGMLDWQLERERVYSRHLGVGPMKFRGAHAGSSVLFWSADLKKKELFALVFLPHDEAGARALLQAGARMAAQLGLERFRVWEEAVDETWKGPGVREERDGSIPMLRPLAAGLTAEDWAWTSRAVWM